jgi:hypothetical protein
MGFIKVRCNKKDEEMAQLIAQNTSSFEDESQDFRYGVAMQGVQRFHIRVKTIVNIQI